MKLSTESAVRSGFGLALGCLVWTNVAAYRSAVNSTDRLRAEQASARLLELVSDLRGAALNMETGTRGYIVSGQKAFLDPYEAGISNAAQTMAELHQAALGAPVQAGTVAILESQIAALTNVCARHIAARTAGAIDASAQVTAVSEEKAAMDSIRQSLGALEEAERKRVADRSAEAHQAVVRSERTILWSGVIAFTAVGAASLLAHRDLGKRTRAEAALRESEERTRQMLAGIRDYAIYRLDPQGRVATWNATAEKIHGFAESEIIGQHFSKLFPPEDAAQGKPGHELAEAVTRGHYEDENQRVRKDGSRFWANVVVSPVLDDQGALQGFVKITRDITERKRAEREIALLNENLRRRAGELESSNRELDAFSYSVSHDLRAPLRHIQGFVDRLKKTAGPRLDDESARYLGIISDSARQMGELIDDLLSFSRNGRIELEPAAVDLESLARGVINDIKVLSAARNILWKMGRLPAVQGDPVLLRQVLVNLLSNAVKYTRPRDPAIIEIDTMNHNPSEHVILVRDNGVGFEMEYVDKLFGVFQRLHRAEDFEGTGIGLANVRRIILRHGGRTWAEGQPDAGATFYFSLPKATSAAAI